MRMFELSRCVAAVFCLLLAGHAAEARQLTSTVTELDSLTRIRPAFPVPEEPDQLFYIERSVNSNTVIYAANLDADGKLDAHNPVTAYWRWYNVDGRKKPLNFMEKMLAYGIKSVKRDGKSGFSFKIAALPERTIHVDLDGKGHPEAYGKAGNRWVKLVYVYLVVDDHGLLPDVTAMDFFGYDKETGKPVHEHVVPH